MVMNSRTMGESLLRERLPALWQLIEDAHYSFLETEDSPEKIQQRKKLDGYITEYLSLVPHECKFGLPETAEVFRRTVEELLEYNASRAGMGWAALARYAANLLAQPWRKEYRTIRLYCGYYKHEVEANMVGAELLLQAMGYKDAGHGKVTLDEPICPDMVTAVSRDALIAQCECQIMSNMWEAAWRSGTQVTWAELFAVRSKPSKREPYQDSEIYSNVPATTTNGHHFLPPIQPAMPPCAHNICSDMSPIDEPIMPVIHNPYVVPTANMMPPNMLYSIPQYQPEMQVQQPHYAPVINQPIMMNYYYPMQPPYMMPTPVYAPIKHAAAVPVNGFHGPQYRYPTVPTGQLIELDAPYENGTYEDHRQDERHRKSVRQPECSRRNSTSKSGFSEVSLPSLPRSDTQPALSKAREDGMGTYESWDYVFRNLSSKDKDEERSGYSPSVDRDSRTLDRLNREERRMKYQPTTLDLEDGLQALTLDRSHDDSVYRTAKVNENLMKLKVEQEQKRARHLARKQASEEKRISEPIGNPSADGLITQKVAADKVRLLTKKDVKERKDVIKQQNSMNGSTSNGDLRKLKKSNRLEEKTVKKLVENGINGSHNGSRSSPGSSIQSVPNYNSKTQLVVTLDVVDAATQNGDHSRSPSQRSETRSSIEKWECGTCTYLNKPSLSACEMCGKSRKGPDVQPLTSGGKECSACTLVNRKDSKKCEACGTSLDHSPTYI